MALDEAAVLNRVRSICAGITGVAAAYSAAADDANGLPDAINDNGPVAIVYPGPTEQYIRSAAAHRHTYQVKVQLLVPGGTVRARMSVAVPFRTRLLDAFTAVAAANQWNSAIFVPPLQLIEGVYAGVEYAGWELTLQVSEQALATAAHGGAG